MVALFCFDFTKPSGIEKLKFPTHHCPQTREKSHHLHLSTANLASSLSVDIVYRAYQIHDFVRDSGFPIPSKAPEETGPTVASIVATSQRPPIPPQTKGRSTRNSKKADQKSYPEIWVVDRGRFINDLRLFVEFTSSYRDTQTFKSFEPVYRSPIEESSPVSPATRGRSFQKSSYLSQNLQRSQKQTLHLLVVITTLREAAK